MRLVFVILQQNIDGTLSFLKEQCPTIAGNSVSYFISFSSVFTVHLYARKAIDCNEMGQVKSKFFHDNSKPNTRNISNGELSALQSSSSFKSKLLVYDLLNEFNSRSPEQNFTFLFSFLTKL